jgi:polysaccharide export outer membrane protein
MKRFFLCIFIFLIFVFINSHALATENTYPIGPGDILEISVWKDESLTREVVVPPDGFISFPLVAEINTNGLTITGLRAIITKKISEYIPDAFVTVMLKQINSLKAYVIGKVNNPGIYGINMETSVMQILAMADGLNPYASESNIFILRQQNGTSVKIPFNYKEIIKGEKLEQNILIKRGDVIVVP